MFKKNNRGQEEMVGFALIVMLVTIILVILLAIVLYKSKDSGQVESYQVESFVSAVLSYTTDCSSTKQQHLPIQRLISECLEGKRCVDGRESCFILNETVSNLVEESWKTGNRPVVGYKFKIFAENLAPIEFSKGNITTKNSRMGTQELILSNNEIVVSLEIFG